MHQTYIHLGLTQAGAAVTPYARSISQFSASDMGCQKSLLSLLKMVRRAMSSVEMAEACAVTVERVNELMRLSMREGKVEQEQRCADGQSGFRIVEAKSYLF